MKGLDKKHIVILDTGREWGGGTESLLELMKRADRRKYSFTAIFYDNYPKGKVSDVKTEIERLGVAFVRVERPSPGFLSKAKKEAMRTLLSFSPAWRKRFISSHDYKERVLPASSRIARVLKEQKADMLYMNNQPSSNIEGILAARALGLRCLQHSRVEIRPSPVEAEAVNEAVSRVICVSKGVMDSLVAGGIKRERCVVVYNGIDASITPGVRPDEIRRRLNVGKDAFIMGTVGSLVKRKRVDMLIEGEAALKDAGVVCLIVGDGPESGRLRKKAKDLTMDGRIIFTGFSTDAISYINAMDVFVLPSQKEGLPRVILEAMLMAKPVIAFNVTGPPELIRDNATGLLLDREDAEAIASAVSSLKNDAGKRRRMGEAGRLRAVKDFSIDRYVNGVTKVFDEVLA